MSKGALGMLAAYWPEDTARYAHVPLKRVTDQVVHANADKHGDVPAVVTAAGATMYRQLSERVKRITRSVEARVDKGGRVAILAADPAASLAVLFGVLGADRTAWLGPPDASKTILEAFRADLLVRDEPSEAGEISPAAFEESLDDGAPEATSRGRPDLKSPVLVLPEPGGEGEIFHNHKTLSATAIAFGSFFMLEPAATVAYLEPPRDWLGFAALLGTWLRGGTAIFAFEDGGVALPDRVDYVVGGWDAVARRAEGGDLRNLRIGAGIIAGVEKHFSVTRRKRLARKLRAPILTLLGRNDLGPVLGCHPSWFLEDAVGIPLPNVDTRPLNPANGTPLAIGWDSVEEAEIGVKSSLAPAGGTIVEGWLRSGIVGEIDPTGLYFLKRSGPVSAVRS